MSQLKLSLTKVKSPVDQLSSSSLDPPLTPSSKHSPTKKMIAKEKANLPVLISKPSDSIPPSSSKTVKTNSPAMKQSVLATAKPSNITLSSTMSAAQTQLLILNALKSSTISSSIVKQLMNPSGLSLPSSSKPTVIKPASTAKPNISIGGVSKTQSSTQKPVQVSVKFLPSTQKSPKQMNTSLKSPPSTQKSPKQMNTSLKSQPSTQQSTKQIQLSLKSPPSILKSPKQIPLKTMLSTQQSPPLKPAPSSHRSPTLTQAYKPKQAIQTVPKLDSKTVPKVQESTSGIIKIQDTDMEPPKAKRPKLHTVLPMSRVKTIMKTNVKSPQSPLNLSQDSVLTVAKATEMFIAELAKGASKSAHESATTPVTYNHLAKSIRKNPDQTKFLFDILPEKVLVKDYLSNLSNKTQE